MLVIYLSEHNKKSFNEYVMGFSFNEEGIVGCANYKIHIHSVSACSEADLLGGQHRLVRKILGLRIMTCLIMWLIWVSYKFVWMI